MLEFCDFFDSFFFLLGRPQLDGELIGFLCLSFRFAATEGRLATAEPVWGVVGVSKVVMFLL